MAHRAMSGLMAASIFGCFALAAPSGLNAQAAFEVMPTAEIPRTYSSWSLFLVCNPAWILENGDKGIAELFHQYKAFGAAIGPKNLAVWFWKQPAEEPTVNDTDVERSSTYCEKFGILPSKSPYVLVTKFYPDDPISGDRFLVQLNGLDAHSSALALAKLTDQMLVTGLNQPSLDSNDWWRRLLSAIGVAMQKTGCYFNKVSFSIKTGAFNAEIEHSTTIPAGGC